ncbi:hypothetical protein NL676_036778 [Syzygium grande]|nr:hypothetical protein NL676_036778 [Syzygium grande]
MISVKRKPPATEKLVGGTEECRSRRTNSGVNSATEREGGREGKKGYRTYRRTVNERARREEKHYRSASQSRNKAATKQDDRGKKSVDTRARSSVAAGQEEDSERCEERTHEIDVATDTTRHGRDSEG